MNRIMIVGQPGSGKSTLARRLGERTGLPVIHIDRIHWQPGWIERSREEKTRLCREAEKGERWIFEGGHSATWSSRIARADMLVWLDRSLSLRLLRVMLRTFKGRGKSRPDLADDCPERLRLLPEFVHYIWISRHSSRSQIAALAASPPQSCRVTILRSDDEIESFVAGYSLSHAHNSFAGPASGGPY